MTAPENFNIDDQSIFYEEFPRSSFISKTARWGKFILYGFIVFHIAAIVIQFVSPFAIKSPDLFFQLLFLLLLWGMVEIVSIPLESCKDSCQVDYQHHWISLHKNRFIYKKLMVLANFNQIQTIGVTAKAAGMSNPFSKNKDDRYAIVFQNLHNRLIRISDFNLSLQEANDFCLRLQSIHLPGAKLIEGEENMEIVLEPVTGEISKRPCKRSSLAFVDEFSIPVFQSIVALIFSYFVFYISFFIIDAAASSLFNTDLKIYQQPTVQLLSGPVVTQDDQIASATPVTQMNLVKKHEIKTPLPIPNASVTSDQQYVSINLDKKTVSTPQPDNSQENKVPEKPEPTVVTTPQISAAVPEVASESLKQPVLPEQLKAGIELVINATETEKLATESEPHLDPLYFPTTVTETPKPEIKTTEIVAKIVVKDDEEEQPKSIKTSDEDKEDKLKAVKPEIIQASIPEIDLDILREIETKKKPEKIKPVKKERVFYQKIPSLKTPIPSTIPSIDLVSIAKAEKAPKPAAPLAKKLEQLLNPKNKTTKKSDKKVIVKTEQPRPVKIVKVTRPKISRPKVKKPKKKPATKESAILPGYGMHPNISLGDHVESCIKKLGKPSLKFKTNDGWQIIYKSFSIITSANKKQKVKRINITKKASRLLGKLVTPQGIKVGSKIETVRDKYGPYTLLDGSPGLHFPHLGISFIPSPNNPKLVGAIEIYKAKKK
jgi:hypothetical protein